MKTQKFFLTISLPLKNLIFSMRTIFLFIAITILASCSSNASSDTVPEDFHADVLLPITPIKDQGSSELCWIYAMLATLETDRLAMGDSINLSPLWCARQSLCKQSQRAFLCEDTISMRGTLTEAYEIINAYGLMPYDSYRADKEILASIKPSARNLYHTARTLAAQKSSLKELDRATSKILNTTLSPAPHLVFLYSMEYTPQEFAESVSLPGEWIAVTSFSHHPYFTSFPLEIPDNRQQHTSLNLPLDSLLSAIDHSLDAHHPVAWEGGMRVINKKMDGELKKKKVNISELSNFRQQLFEKHILTDDHCMSIIGYGHTPDNKRYYILKNSWGEDNGLYYLSRQDLLLRTIMVMIKAETLKKH